MTKTQLSKYYTWEHVSSGILSDGYRFFIYYIGLGANIWRSGTNTQLADRVEISNQGKTEADLTPEELRQRMWWRKAIANFRTTFKDFETYQHLASLPDNEGEMDDWVELPPHLKQ
ncbi:MAG: hypothetical protein ACI8W1_001508 [Candidatus Azotimanducaceae bacterium]|jgi:hypothetical protein